MSTPRAHPLTDLELSRRLERTEGRANAAFVESRARTAPAAGATWCEYDGTFAMFDGVGSPCTQTFGFGLFVPPAAEQLQALEEFFESRGAAVVHEVSPMADSAAIPLLVARGYHPVELTSVMCQILPATPATGPASPIEIGVRRIAADEINLWAETAAAGWSDTADVEDFMRTFGVISAQTEGTHAFLADRDGVPIAAGAIHLSAGVALLAGASTIPAGRRQGAQTALLQARLRYAAVQGCDLAMMCAAPGSASQRNAERRGFRIAYTRIKWGRG